MTVNLPAELMETPAVVAAAQLYKEARALETQAVTLTIATNKELMNASELLSRVAKLRKDLETRRKFIVDPLNKQVKQINEAFKFWSAPLDHADRVLRKGIADYQAEQRRRAEEERRRQDELERNRLEALEQAVEQPTPKGEPATIVFPVPPPPVSEPLRTVKTSAGLVSTRKRWTFEVLDLSVVPREYLMLNERAVREAIRQGVREIPGLRIYEEDDVVVRQ